MKDVDGVVVGVMEHRDLQCASTWAYAVVAWCEEAGPLYASHIFLP